MGPKKCISTLSSSVATILLDRTLLNSHNVPSSAAIWRIKQDFLNSIKIQCIIYHCHIWLLLAENSFYNSYSCDTHDYSYFALRLNIKWVTVLSLKHCLIKTVRQSENEYILYIMYCILHI